MRLANLQRWMQAVVVHPGTTDQALRSRAASRQLKAGRIGSVLLPSKTLTAAQRIAIYQGMFPMRMRDAVAADYPGLEHFLGSRFPEFVAAYSLAHPSMAYTLNRLGDHVPAFLGKQTSLKPRGFLRDLASLELAITECFDAPEAELLQEQELAAIPADRLGRSRLLTSPSLRLVAIEWNAEDYLDTVRNENHDHPRPRRSPRFIVVVRRTYSVYRFPVSEAGFLVLKDLRDGRPISEVVQRAMSRRGARRAKGPEFAEWFRRWAAEGVFSGLRRHV